MKKHFMNCTTKGHIELCNFHYEITCKTCAKRVWASEYDGDKKRVLGEAVYGVEGYLRRKNHLQKIMTIAKFDEDFKKVIK